MQHFTPEAKALREVYEDIDVDEKARRAVIDLQGRDDRRYTELANEIERLKVAEAEVKQIKNDIREGSRQLIEGLFGADLELYTRIVNCTEVTFKLSKTPEPANNVQYRQVLEALQEHLTPELAKKVEDLKKEFTKVVHKRPALSVSGRLPVKELADQNAMEVAQIALEFKEKIMKWLPGWDKRMGEASAKLDAITNQFSLSGQ